MPKRSVSGQADPGGDILTRPIGIWVATGLSLAVTGMTTQLGVFTVYAVVLLSPMVYVFARLHRQAPDARTTSDLLAAVLGERFGVFAGLLQLIAYLVIGAKFARLVAVNLLGQFLSVDLVGQHGSRFEYVHFASAKSGTAYTPTVSNQWTDIDRRHGNQGSNGTGSVRAVGTRRNLAQPHSPEKTTLSSRAAVVSHRSA